MIAITPQMRILLAVEPVDFRKGIDGLAGWCRQALAADPFSGTLFVFSSRSRQSLKIICYDGQGFWLCQKRLSQGRFVWWPSDRDGTKTCRLDVHQIQLLLWNGDPTRSSAAPMWRAVVPSG
jgi:transposase